MGSSNSTAHLRLNQWSGADKPKMADFNADNSRLDTAVGGHLADTAGHLAAGERVRWEGAVPLIGSYTGDGLSSRSVAAGFRPSFGVVFGIDQNIVQSIGSTGNMRVCSAFLSAGGCSQGARIDDNGFTVYSLQQIVSGRLAMLNESGLSYVYILFR